MYNSIQVKVSRAKKASKTYYEIALTSAGSEWVVQKRFSAVRAFHRSLEGRLSLPAFPERRSVRKRQAALEEYLPSLLQHASDPSVVQFFGVQPQLETGTLVRVCVDTPLNGWQGLVDKDSVGVVVTNDNDLVVVAFKGPGRWLGLASELQVVEDDTDVVSAVLQAHHAFSRAFTVEDNIVPMSTAMPQAQPRMDITEYRDDVQDEEEEPRQVPEPAGLTAADAFCAGGYVDDLCAYFRSSS